MIIPSLGRLVYLNELLATVYNQTLPPAQVLVLLDNNDHCRSMAQSLMQGNGLKILFCDGLNLSQKRNLGANLAKTELLIYSDDDDIWAQTRGEFVHDALLSFAVCCHNFGKFGFTKQHSCSSLGMSDRIVAASNSVIGANVFGGGSSIGVKKFVVQAIPFSPDYLYCEDFHWWLRVLFSGIKVRYLGADLVQYRTHNSNMTNKIFDISTYGFKLALELFTLSFTIAATALMVSLRSICRLALVPLIRWLYSFKVRELS